jgi:hypothetical protein
VTIARFSYRPKRAGKKPPKPMPISLVVHGKPPRKRHPAEVAGYAPDDLRARRLIERALEGN